MCHRIKDGGCSPSVQGNIQGYIDTMYGSSCAGIDADWSGLTTHPALIAEGVAEYYAYEFTSSMRSAGVSPWSTSDWAGEDWTTLVTNDKSYCNMPGN